MVPYRISKVLFGGDYNPEQWPREVWHEDMRLFKLAHVDTVTLNVFSWARIQPSEDTYDFADLDEIMNLVRENGLNVCLATSTAAHSAWMAHRHPDVLRVGQDGMKRSFGARHNSCPNSPTYRHYAPLLAKKLAERYGDMGNIVAWHVSNEYGGLCYCENCAAAFRVWLRKRYGTIDAVNRAWNTSFWGHTFYDWEEIVPADFRSEEWSMGGRVRTNFQGISLDYRRFMSDSLLECFCLERDAIRAVTPDIPVTTNMMGLYYELDYGKWAKEMDFIAWDSYPSYGEPANFNILRHDVMRGVGGGKAFWLMEQTPSVSNWHQYCALKRPGVMRRLSYEAMARGADTVMFFQMRRSIGACEKYHGALIDHAGRSDTRVFREMAALGEELDKLGDVTLGGTTDARVALIFDWDNWWATSLSAGPSADIDAVSELARWHAALLDMNVPVDVVGVDAPLDKYAAVVAPMLYMVKGDYDETLRGYVRRGGTLIATSFSGYVQENDLVMPGGYPGSLRDIFGVWVEEIDALPPDRVNGFVYNGVRYPARLLCDVVHTEGAKALAHFETDFYAGMPALTCNDLGEGHAYYVATCPDEALCAALLGDVLKAAGVAPIMDTPRGVIASVRENERGRIVYIINQTDGEQSVTLPFAGRDLLTGTAYAAGDAAALAGNGVMLIHID